MSPASTDHDADFLQPLPQGFRPSETDVICGRGRGYYNCPGNVRFRRVVREYLPIYKRQGRKCDKTACLSDIVVHMKTTSSKFVKQLSNGRWYELSDAAAREKVGNAMREAVSENARQQKRESPPPRVPFGWKLLSDDEESETVDAKRAGKRPDCPEQPTPSCSVFGQRVAAIVHGADTAPQEPCSSLTLNSNLFVDDSISNLEMMDCSSVANGSCRVSSYSHRSEQSSQIMFGRRLSNGCLLSNSIEFGCDHSLASMTSRTESLRFGSSSLKRHHPDTDLSSPVSIHDSGSQQVVSMKELQ